MSWCQCCGPAVLARHRNPAFRRENPRLAEDTLGGAAESMACNGAAAAQAGCSPGCRPGSDVFSASAACTRGAGCPRTSVVPKYADDDHRQHERHGPAERGQLENLKRQFREVLAHEVVEALIVLLCEPPRKIGQGGRRAAEGMHVGPRGKEWVQNIGEPPSASIEQKNANAQGTRAQPSSSPMRMLTSGKSRGVSVASRPKICWSA